MIGAPLAVSLGEPAGIGPEIIAKAWRALRETGPAFVVVGDARRLMAQRNMGPDRLRRVDSPARAAEAFADALPVIDLPLPARVREGHAEPANAASVISWIETAVKLTLGGATSALVTAPIAKAPLYEAGFAFPGHTEFLGVLAPAAEGRARGPVMMLAVAGLRASLVTIHEPLAKVPGLITRDAIVNAGLVTDEALRRDFGLSHPRLAVAALNPHAGEDGALGGEEAAVVAPAIGLLRAAGVDATGPFPADSLFHVEARARYDAALCLYHDQALIPVKMLDFWGGVNLTLGLSIVRTSPDHGVGFDIAGAGVARPDSLVAALRLAAEIAERRAAP